MQYLIRTINHNGKPFTDVTKIRDNETYQVVDAESKEEAKEKYEEQVKRDAIIKLGQLFENIRECGK